MIGSPWTNACVKRMVATADAPTPRKTPAIMYRVPARQSARSDGTRNGSVTSTSTTCSPKTIVAAEVEWASGRRKKASVPHIAAATLISSTPGQAVEAAHHCAERNA